ncbi:MAG: ECF transporter S component [Oscillospiraceae bacterium]|nr:ECF transporter S component [Oscillospiraceae bacterium]
MSVNNKRKHLSNLIIAAVCLALAMVLPFLTGQILQIGSALSPMHIPVFLCAFFCGPYYAVIVGAVSPLLRFVLFGMPPIFPIGAAMCFELAVYGLAAGLLYKTLPQKKGFVFASLIAAMLCGRVVWGAAMAVLSGAAGNAFTWRMFLAGAFTNAIPGIILHIILVPAVVIALAPRLHKRNN